MKIFLFLTLWVFLAIPPVAAAEALAFTHDPGRPDHLAIQNYFRGQSNQQSDFFIADPDLNNDNIPEFIVYDSLCDYSKKPCVFKILSDTEKGIVPLGEITAYRVALDGKSAYGVRNLRAYKNKANDYDYAVYVWEPLDARYKMNGSK